MIKKGIQLLISTLLISALAACSSQNNENSRQISQPTSTSESAVLTSIQESQESTKSSEELSAEELTEPSYENSDPETESGKTLVVYYSASGNTKAVADYIDDATNVDRFELIPVNPYSDDDLDWTNENSRVVYEYNNPDDRNVELVETTVADWDSYDTIFIGYPIWWEIAAWPVNNFIKANDFTGKTVIPFCTSSSSSLGDSGKLLAEAAGSGNWQEGERFSSNASQETVQTWIKSLMIK